ncbi:hypothetical protein ASG52_07185 [Methylobacterium sp. Leaf456]|uniref:E2 domain-containing protein n=1 Tax=Methylobacterium sp. Leaf456 TaxID=1736382 RepID=UPI0006F242B7|nr:hypothetical protein ASG52_07185 [Methylobacterium sp. Leaf456]
MASASFALALALAGAPAWFQLNLRSSNHVAGVATIPINAVEATFVVELEVKLLGRNVRARERIPGTMFPKRCFERHIEADGWFCLGLADRIRITDAQSASAWWELLEAYLRMQRTATQTGMWPEHHALSHGEAGLHHQNALEHAEKAGLADEYEAFMQGDPSFLISLDELLRRDGDRLRNGRCPCPCGRKRSDGRTLLRRDCPQRADVVSLLREERLRKDKLAHFVDTLKGSGMTCCGTMRVCPFR